MSKRTWWLGIALLTESALLIACGSTYLSDPPPEFIEYIESVPTPSLSVQIAEDTQRVIAPRDTCTSFVYVRLYGTNESYAAIRMGYEQLLNDAMGTYAVVPGESEHVTFVVSEVATVGLTNVVSDNPVALLYFEQETLIRAQESFATLFILDVEHSYGNCAPNPYWQRERKPRLVFPASRRNAPGQESLRH